MIRGVLLAALALAAPAAGAPSAGAAQRSPVPILMYHHLGVPPAGARSPALWVRPARFAEQVRALRRAGYQAVTLGRVWRAWNGIGSLKLPRRPIVLTFDDGYADQVTHALPVLARERWPGVLNLAVDFLPGMGGVPAVQRLLAARWEVDSHSLSHADLTTLDPTALQAEVEGSRARIRELLGGGAFFFSYPNGRLNATVVSAVRRAGYLAATTTRHGYATPRDLMRLSRIQVGPAMRGADLLQRLRVLRPR
ncbi:MAG TPA: polysaccharide deacetylase family protein [Solirubrobacteraceae bacterium]|nr:polysaccharide deacetylase family protein [Solirubrobacteraceae bacterium]